MQQELHHYIALVKDPSLENEVLVFSVRAHDPRQSRKGIALWYEEQGWPNEGISIRLVLLRQKSVQLIGHAPVDKDSGAIRRLCEEVLNIASDEPVIAYADKLRMLVRSFTIGEKVFQYRYGE